MSDLATILAEQTAIEFAADQNRDPVEDALQEQAISAQSVFYEILREQLLAKLTKRYQEGADIGELLELSQDILLANIDPLSAMLSDAELVAWIVGAGSVARILPDVEPDLSEFVFQSEPIRPGVWEWNGGEIWLPLVEEASKDLRERNLFTREEFDRLNDLAKSRAFTVAFQDTHEAIGKVRDAVVESVERGLMLDDFRDRLSEDLDTSTIGLAHSETILRTNVGQAYSNGQDRIGQHPIVVDQFPYRQRMVIGDSRQTELCHTLARSGIDGTAIMRADDPVWQRFRPLSHYNCRCGTRLLSVSQAARLGIREAQEWKDSGFAPSSPQWVPYPSVELPKGWAPGGGLTI